MRPFIELLRVRDVRQDLEPAPLDARGWPVDAVPAEIRTLPYPFATYVGLSNDCDDVTISFDVVRKFYRIVREELNLPFADSFFPDHLTRGIVPHDGMAKVENVNGVTEDPSGAEFRNRIGNYIRHFHLGWFDTVHGFVASLVMKVAYTDAKQREVESAELIAREPMSPYLPWTTVLAVNSARYPARQRFKFYAPAEWKAYAADPPRYLVLNYSAPRIGSNIVARLFEGDRHIGDVAGQTQESTTPHAAAMDYVIDLWTLIGLDQNRLHALEVEISIGGQDGAFVEINNIVLINHLRSDLKRYQRVMERYNLTTSAYTSHGVGLVLAPRFGREAAAADTRKLADLPSNPHYAVDILWDYGVRFVNSYSNTSRKTISTIDQLTFLNSFGDGRVFYDFHRYIYAPKNEKGQPDPDYWQRGGTQVHSALVDTLGENIFGLLSEIADRPGNGGLVYTHVHWATNPPNPVRDPEVFTRPMNQLTRRAFHTLAERYYDLSGTTPQNERIWLASVPVLLRYSAVKKGLAGRAFYRRSSNTVYIEPWFDAALGEVVPNVARDFRGVTFYVEEAHTARVFVGDREYPDLIRNPKDETGRESVTMADVSAPLVLAGRVPLPATRASIAVTGAEWVFGDVSEVDVERQGVQITLTAARARLSVSPCKILAANYQALRLVVTRSDPAVRFGFDMEFASGLKLRIAEDGLDGADGAYRIAPYDGTSTRSIVIPFYSLLRGMRKGKSPGIDRVGSWTLTVQGPVGSRLRLNALHLLRDCEQKDGGDGFVVAGSVKESSQAVARVRMRYDRLEYETVPTADGVYFFDRKVAADSVVEIFGLDDGDKEIDPTNGRLVHIMTNKSDIDFGA